MKFGAYRSNFRKRDVEGLLGHFVPYVDLRCFADDIYIWLGTVVRYEFRPKAMNFAAGSLRADGLETCAGLGVRHPAGAVPQ